MAMQLRVFIPALAAIVFAVASAARSQESAPALDAQDPSLDELLEIPGRPAPEKKPAPTRPGVERIEDEPATEPFELAVEGMHDAAGRLVAHDTSIETQRVQEQVVRRLDSIISQFRRSQSQRQQQSARQQDTGSQEEDGQENQAAEQASNSPTQGPGRRGQPKTGQLSDEPLKEQFDEWGHLPPRLRDQIRNTLKESYSSLYRELTERYYQRLAEEAP